MLWWHWEKQLQNTQERTYEKSPIVRLRKWKALSFSSIEHICKRNANTTLTFWAFIKAVRKLITSWRIYESPESHEVNTFHINTINPSDKWDKAMRSLGFITNVMFIERYWVSISKMELVKPLQIKYFHFLLCHIRQQSNSPYKFFLLTNFSSSYPRKSLPSIFTVRKQSCGKVRFSQACVKNSVHRGEVYTPPRADTPHGQTSP